MVNADSRNAPVLQSRRVSLLSQCEWMGSYTMIPRVLRLVDISNPHEPALHPNCFSRHQVILCSYMSVDAFMIAYRNNYPAFCAPFNTENPPVANLLWLFYISKVQSFTSSEPCWSFVGSPAHCPSFYKYIVTAKKTELCRESNQWVARGQYILLNRPLCSGQGSWSWFGLPGEMLEFDIRSSLLPSSVLICLALVMINTLSCWNSRRE